MIVLNLVCSAGHKFEGWFASTESFDTQVRDDLVNCPHCNSHRIDRLPVAPHLARRVVSDTDSSDASSNAAELVDMLERIAAGSEDVGRKFPEEARRIHYRETAARSIRGQASLDEARELLEEGIPVIPVPAKNRSH
jgi:hypothetical protein